MRLKDYQVKALEALSRYLDILAAEHKGRAAELADIEKLPAQTRERVMSMLGDPVADAWKKAQGAEVAASPDPWRPLQDGAGRSVPHLCLKLPTGGGKTLLAAHGVERIVVSYFQRLTGFILWIVPSDAIYRQTKKQLSDRESAIRQVLDRASAGRVKILEKLDGFTKQDVQERLCVLLLMLPSANRESRETLKVFRDSGRYMSFFPQDNPVARAELRKAVPNLEEFDLAEAALGGADSAWIKQSLGNVLRMVRPIIVLDEGHRAYGELARSTLKTLNPSFLLELTATPNREFSNILVDVPGRVLRDAQMIKLPIRLEVEKNVSWKDTLRQAVDRLNALEKEAKALRAQTNRYIRPIMLVRVDLTGEEQLGKSGKGKDAPVHSQDAYDFLVQHAGFKDGEVRRQTAELKELADDDLLSELSPVRAIVTKDALREGWDCPFAYVLAILSKGTARTALTQMIGRVLRQPDATRTERKPLDEAHVFCAEIKVADAIAMIKKGLEAEGMGDLGDAVIAGDKKQTQEIRIPMRERFRSQRIMVPQVLHRAGKEKLRPLDYDADILSCINWDSFSYRGADEFNVVGYDRAQRTGIEVDIAAGDDFALAQSEVKSEYIGETRIDRPALIRRLLDVIPNPWQGARVLDEALDVLRARAKENEIIAAKFELTKAIADDVGVQVEEAAASVFREKVKSGDIVFRLLAAPLGDLNIEFEPVLVTHAAFGDDLPLLHQDGSQLERSLYERALRKDFNKFEADVALYLDEPAALQWWWRIAVRKDWALQGWRRNKVYPDFLVKLESDGATTRLLVLETKGKFLDNADTTFKQELFELLEGAYAHGREAGQMELLADAPGAMRFRILLQETAWKSDLEKHLV